MAWCPHHSNLGAAATAQLHAPALLLWIEERTHHAVAPAVLAEPSMGSKPGQHHQRHVPALRAGLPVVGEIEAPGFLEGGDFFPAGRRALPCLPPSVLHCQCCIATSQGSSLPRCRLPGASQQDAQTYACEESLLWCPPQKATPGASRPAPPCPWLTGGTRACRRDLALVGIGLRSNYEACHQLMANDWLGTRRLAVVRDDFEQHQARGVPSLPVHAAGLLCRCCLWTAKPFGNAGCML